MGNGVTPFDLAAHQRDRIRTLERDNQHLNTHRARLERILAITLKIAAGQDADPRILLRAIYEIERHAWLDSRVELVLTDDRMEQVLGDSERARTVA